MTVYCNLFLKLLTQILSGKGLHHLPSREDRNGHCYSFLDFHWSPHKSEVKNKTLPWLLPHDGTTNKAKKHSAINVCMCQPATNKSRILFGTFFFHHKHNYWLSYTVIHTHTFSLPEARMGFHFWPFCTLFPFPFHFAIKLGDFVLFYDHFFILLLFDGYSLSSMHLLLLFSSFPSLCFNILISCLHSPSAHSLLHHGSKFILQPWYNNYVHSVNAFCTYS